MTSLVQQLSFDSAIERDEPWSAAARAYILVAIRAAHMWSWSPWGGAC